MAIISNGTTIADAGAFSASLGSMVLIKKLTVSAGDGSKTFVNLSGGEQIFTSTFQTYHFTFTNIHPANDNVNFQVNFRDSDTNYDAPKTTTFFRAYHGEGGEGGVLQYQDNDLANGTGVQVLAESGNDNDQCTSGTLTLFSPLSTTFVKHFISNFNFSNGSNYSMNTYCAGYINATSIVDGVQFSFSSGDMGGGGEICCYGIKES